MSITGIILIIAGVIVLALGYLLPAKKNDMDEEFRLISEDEVRKMVDREVDSAKEHIFDIIDESVTYAMEKTERSMERVTNEKIMAVNEYSDTVLEEINKNHKEVLFLYDMLNDKHDNLKETISDAAGAAEEVKQMVRDAQITADEVQEAVKEVEMTVKNADETARNVMEAVLEMKDFDKTIRENAAVMYKEQEPVYEAPARRRRTKKTEDIEDVVIEERKGKKAVKERTIEPDIEEEDVMIPQDTEEAPYYTTMKEELALAYDDEEMKDVDDIEETGVEDEPEDDFMPITPPRVAIIHDIDGDYVAGEQPQEAYPQPEERRRPAKRQTEAKSVNIQFANGKDKSRNSNERILELHKAGKSNMAIAKELGLGIGEVKLVIDLFEGM